MLRLIINFVSLGVHLMIAAVQQVLELMDL
jgi:hypothetical protein